MKKIHIISAFLGLIFPFFILAQSKKESKIDTVIAALNAKDASRLLEMMTANATIGDLDPGANAVYLPAILKNFTKINTFSIVSDNTLADGNRYVKLKVTYEDNRSGSPSLTFTPQGQLLNLGIIRTRKKADTELALKDALTGVVRPDSVTIPFRLENGLIYVPAKLNGTSGYFLFDSGCPVVLLNKRFTDRLKDVRGVSFDFMGMGGKMEDLVWSKENHLEWAGTNMLKLDAPASEMENRELPDGAPYFGLLGYGMFCDYQLTFDYPRQVLLLEKVDSLGKLKTSPMRKGTLLGKAPMEMSRHIPVVTLDIKGKAYKMGLDCGANANVLQAQLRSQLGNSFDVEEEGVSINGVGASDERSTSGFVVGASLEGVKLDDMFTVLTSQPIGAGTGSQSLGVVGLLGTPFLNLHRTTLNFAERTISFYK